MKEFPWEHEARKPVLFYPEDVVDYSGDILEVGPGRGDLLLDLAEAMPGKRFVAIEIGKKRFNKLIPRIDKRGLKNILLIGGDARIVLPRHFNDHSFEKIYVLFPDPWPKKRHAPKRLLQTDFIALLSRFLKPGGNLFMATDVAWYADWVVENCKSISEICNMGDPFVTAEELFGYAPTFFEQKWRAEGRKIYYMSYKRI